MGWVSDIVSGVGSFISGAGSLISSAIGSLVGLASIAGNILNVVSPYLGIVTNIISVIGNILGVKKDDENLEDIGAKAMKSDKKPENFDSYNDYIKHLRENIKLDKEEMENASKELKLARTAVGATIVSKGIEEKKGMEISVDTWVAMAKAGLDGKIDVVNLILDTFKDKNEQKDFANYVDGKAGFKEEKIVTDKLTDIYKSLEPNASDIDIEKKVMDMDKSK